MIYNIAVLQSFNREDKRLLAKVMDILFKVEEYVKKIAESSLPTFECHATCRAIALHIRELKVADGHYVGVSRKRRKDKVDARLRYCDHSWLVTPSGSIIDPYPVGFLALNPILVVTRGIYKNFGGGLYWPDKRVTERIFTRDLCKRVEIFSSIISEAAAIVI